jgi:hypothetical protein
VSGSDGIQVEFPNVDFGDENIDCQPSAELMEGDTRKTSQE